MKYAYQDYTIYVLYVYYIYYEICILRLYYVEL